MELTIFDRSLLKMISTKNKVVKRGGKVIFDPRKCRDLNMTCEKWLDKQDRNTKAVARIHFI